MTEIEGMAGIDIDTCFDLDSLDSMLYRDLFRLATSPITELILQYKTFDAVLDHAQLDYDIQLISRVCGMTERATSRQLLERYIISVLNFFDCQEEKTLVEYQEIRNAYQNCLYSKK